VVHPASYSVRTVSTFAEGRVAKGVKLTTHLHLVPNFRMGGAVTPAQDISRRAQEQHYLSPLLQSYAFSSLRTNESCQDLLTRGYITGIYKQ
jgi:hypothetical protein